MNPEPRNNSVDMPELLWNNWTVFTEGGNDFSFNQTNIKYAFWSHYPFRFIVYSFVYILIGFFGMVGNGIVIWLLSFCLKRNHYSVYILNLAIADFTYLSALIANNTFLKIFFPRNLLLFTETLEMSSYLVGLSLLMAVSVERCVSVLWPIWYKCHRPIHLSTIVCTIVWVFFNILWYLITLLVELSSIMWIISGLMSLPTILVLFVSSLTLFIRVQYYSRQKNPSRLYWTILLNVLAFLALCVPRGVYIIYFLSLYPKSSETGLYITTVFCAVNSTVNPIIYFFVGRHGHQRGRKSLREVLQRALTDNAEAEERRAPSPHRA